MQFRHVLAAVTALGTAVAFAPTTAHADPIPACGDIDFAGATNVSCHLDTSGGCAAACTPISCTASVSASCTGMVDASCTESCGTSCSASCTADPGTFSCSGACETNCDASCSGQCSSSSDTTTCMGQCSASCTNECNVSCSGTSPTVTCDAQCQASCEGSCNVQANFSCQESASAACTGGCTTQCSAPEGALFCDLGNGLGDQYVDVDSSNLAACASALNSMYGLNLSVSAAGACNGAGTCTGSVSVGGCAVAPPNDAAPLGMMFAGFGLVVGAVVRGRRKK